jgi:hypothetical protein
VLRGAIFCAATFCAATFCAATFCAAIPPSRDARASEMQCRANSRFAVTLRAILAQGGPCFVSAAPAFFDHRPKTIGDISHSKATSTPIVNRPTAPGGRCTPPTSRMKKSSRFNGASPDSCRVPRSQLRPSAHDTPASTRGADQS